jgi:hypothetical protein
VLFFGDVRFQGLIDLLFHAAALVIGEIYRARQPQRRGEFSSRPHSPQFSAARQFKASSLS